MHEFINDHKNNNENGKNQGYGTLRMFFKEIINKINSLGWYPIP